MSKKNFTKEEIEELRDNRFIKTVSESTITYTDEFKLHFISENQKGIPRSVIFKKAGFDPKIVGTQRILGASRRWNKAFHNNGVDGLQDMRRINGSKPCNSKISPDKIIAKQKAEIEYLKAEVELLKKLELAERQVMKDKLRPVLIFEMIEGIINKHNLNGMVSHLCASAGVSRSGYYHFKDTKEYRAKQHQKDSKDMELIKQAYHLNKHNKGSRGIYMTLFNDFQIIMNRKKIQRLMRKFGLVCPIRAANPYKKIFKATDEHKAVPNILNRKFKDGNPGQILLTDITYIPFRGRFVYLSVIKDSVTNEVMSHHLSKNLKHDIVTKTIEKLLLNRRHLLSSNTYVHSDQGTHYTHPKFQKLLKKLNLGQSMSRKGNCWDNAPIESFFGHMKDELDFKQCYTFNALETMIDDYMYYYNNGRYQWNLKKLTPVMYRNQFFAA